MLSDLIWLWVGFVVITELIVLNHTGGLKKRMTALARKYTSSYTPFASVIVPFRGKDPGLEDNVRAILSQKYPRKEFIFVVDSKKDPAYSVLKKFQKKNVRIVLSRKLTGCSGKNAALISGVTKAKGSVFVFADSDIRPLSNWLSEMVKPLRDPNVGSTTGYRWYVPTDKKITSYIRAAWAAIGIGMMAGKFVFVWGGSFALRKEVFEEFSLLRQWSASISDDIDVTRSCRKSDYRIHFVPTALVATYENASWDEMKEFVFRQLYIIRTCYKNAWRGGMISYGITSFTFLTGIVLLAVSPWKPTLFLPGLSIVALQLLAPLRSYVRTRAMTSLTPGHPGTEQLGWKAYWAELFVRPVNFYGLLKAKKMKSVQWRGRVYKN